MLKVVLSGNTYEVKETLKSPEFSFRYNAIHKNWEKQLNSPENADALRSRLRSVLSSAGVRAAAFDAQTKRLVWWEDFGRVRQIEDSGEDEREGARTNSETAEVQSHTTGQQDSTMAEETIHIPLWLARRLNCAATLVGQIVETAYREIQTSRGLRRLRCYHFVGRNAIGGTDRCHRCHRPLTDPVSRIVGYGAECCRILGVSRRIDMNDESNAAEVEQIIRSQRVDVWIPTGSCRRVR